MRVQHQAAYILLNRPYSETSWIIELFSRDYGRLALMAKGARRIKSTLKGSLLPFQPVLLSWTGKGDIPTLTSAEIDQNEYSLQYQDLKGDALVCGFYCNELIVNLLHRHDPHVRLFDHYHATIMALYTANDNDALSNTLRIFEQALIKETGYEVSFDYEADGKTAIEDQAHYRFQSGQGFVRLAGSQRGSVTGSLIRSLSVGDSMKIQDDSAVSASNSSAGKHLMRDILNQTIGYKPIISRELFYPKTRREQPTPNVN